MTRTDPATAPRPTMKRVALASYTGTAIEFYDFYIYGTAAALVFPKIFFPALGETAGTVASFATFGVAFIARPIGGAVFGHFGDRLGRKRTLVATLLIMGLATLGVGLLPSAASIGIAAPIILVLLRLLQGFAVGGEWAGAALLTAEYAPPKSRGAYGMATQLGPSTAFVASSLTFLITNVTLGDDSEAFIEWGWRVPFLFSAVLVIIGLYVRVSIDETPAFKADVQRASTPLPAPFFDLMKNQWKRVLLGTGAMTGVFASFFLSATYMMSYGTMQLGHNRTEVLTVGIIGGAAMAVTTVISAILCDAWGRRKLILIGMGLSVAWALVLFPLVDTGSVFAFGFGVSVMFLLLGIAYGPVGSFLPELFETRYRYTGAALSFNLAGVVGGAVPPLVAGALVASFGSIAVGVLLSGLVFLSVVSVALLRDRPQTSLTDTHPVEPTAVDEAPR
ncbi:MAG: MFS transporter [Mycobacterium sp.]